MDLYERHRKIIGEKSKLEIYWGLIFIYKNIII